MNIHNAARGGPFVPSAVYEAPDKFASLSDVKALTEKLAEITGKFQAKSDELAKFAETSQAEIKAKGALLEETKAQADKLLVEQAKLTGEKNELAARLQAVEAHVAKRESVSGPEARKSIGQQLVDDEKVKSFIDQARGGFKGIHRFVVKAAMKTSDVAPVTPGVLKPQEVAPLPRLVQRLFVRDLLDVGQTNQPSISYMRETGFTNNAAVVSEGDVKPTSTITYDEVMTPVRTIAHLFKASKQILDDLPRLRSDVDREMRYGVKYAEEQELLFGDGTGIHLNGIVTQASAYHHAFVAPNHTIIDDIRLAMLQSQLARLPATGIVLHFTDWARVELTKDSTGQYLWANPLRIGIQTLWGLPVVQTEISAMQGKLLVGAFRDGATIYDREEVNVEIATQNNDDFERNLLTIRCEERLALAVFRPTAFVYGAFIVTT
jgi:HK97 family phage major capsid protein